MAAVVAALGLDARYVLFGHTHRAGPLPGDDAAGWTLPGGARLMNTGSWVLDRALTGPGSGGPYWPGGAIALDGDGTPPRAERLLDDVSGARLHA